MRAFRLWDKYAQPKGGGKETESILVTKGQKLEEQRTEALKQGIEELVKAGFVIFEEEKHRKFLSS